MKILSILFPFFCLLKNNINNLPLPLNEYAYMIARNELQLQDSLNLEEETTEKERLVNIYFGKLKSDEFKRTSSKFHASLPIETELDSIKSSELFQKLKLLPKGGNKNSLFWFKFKRACRTSGFTHRIL